MATSDVDHATHDRRVSAEANRVSQDFTGDPERAGALVSLRRVDQQKARHGRWRSFCPRQLQSRKQSNAELIFILLVVMCITTIQVVIMYSRNFARIVI